MVSEKSAQPAPTGQFSIDRNTIRFRYLVRGRQNRHRSILAMYPLRAECNLGVVATRHTELNEYTRFFDGAYDNQQPYVFNIDDQLSIAPDFLGALAFRNFTYLYVL